MIFCYIRINTKRSFRVSRSEEISNIQSVVISKVLLRGNSYTKPHYLNTKILTYLPWHRLSMICAKTVNRYKRGWWGSMQLKMRIFQLKILKVSMPQNFILLIDARLTTFCRTHDMTTKTVFGVKVLSIETCLYSMSLNIYIACRLISFLSWNVRVISDVKLYTNSHEFNYSYLLEVLSRVIYIYIYIYIYIVSCTM